MSDTVVVIGGGIAGIQASLDLAEAGAKVVLVEREPTIGGIMAVLDKNFPTLDCSICIEAPKMSEVDLHPNIEVLSPAEVVSISGLPGDFTVEINERTRFVSDECTRCGECTVVCPVVQPNEYDSGMAFRKAIYTPIPQSVPGTYLIDINNCLNNPPNYLPCNHCQQVCPPQAIDFLMPKETMTHRNAGSIIIATGYSMIDPRVMSEYGYGSHPDILSAMEFERLINSAGPTGGEIIRPSTGEHLENILFVLCVGSRDHRHYRHCSRFCCMYSIKHAYQAIDHHIKDVTVLYMDIRAYGKGFDGFWQRTEAEGAKFIRGRPARITPLDNQRLSVHYEDFENHSATKSEFDMVVLANAVAPPKGLLDLATRLGLEIGEDGFLSSAEEVGGLVATSLPGIYAAGCVSGPKDIPDSVAEGSGAAALALSHIAERSWPEIPEIEPIAGIQDPRIGVFICHCGSNIAGVIDIEKLVSLTGSLPGVVHVSNQMFSCAGNTQQEIEDKIKRENINRVVIAACSPKTHETIFRGVMIRSGLNPYLLEMANIRNMASWVHKNNSSAATIKAFDMVAMAVNKARLLTPLESSTLPLRQSALVIGGGIAGMTAATALDRQGFETHLVEHDTRLGGALNHLSEIAPADILAADLTAAKMREIEASKIKVHLNSKVDTIAGLVGNFQIQLQSGNQEEKALEVGAVVVATGANIYVTEEFGYKTDPNVINNLELEELFQAGSIQAERITFVACVGSRQNGQGCSRYCCTSMLHQAKKLRAMGKKVHIIYKDIRTYTRHSEELYEEVMRMGVRFYRYNPNQTPQQALLYVEGQVEIFDQQLGANIIIPTDMLVLVVGLVPVQDNLAEQLKLARSEDGFYMELHPKLGPVQTAIQGVFLAGAAQGPKDVRESIAQALAAAGKAGALLARGVIEKEPLTAQLIPDLCKGCLRCVRVCPYNAIEQIAPAGEAANIRILEAACMGCGTCAAECNFDAIEMPYFTKDQILTQIEAALSDAPHQKCLVFTCNWCSYAGADLAGIEKRQYPPSTRIIRTMCSARFEEGFVQHSFDKGAGAVLITGCRLTDTGSDCHYNYANRLTWERFKRWQRKFERKGIAPERLQLRWISAAEGKEFAEQMHKMDAVIQTQNLDP